MKKRRALLVGVPEYESDALEDLPVVRRDLEILHSTLENTGYGVRTIGTEGIDQTGQNKIDKAIRKELRDAKGLDVLLLYFSGHGVHYRGKDYLIPSDADFDYTDDPDFVRYLIAPDDFHDAVDKCNAKTIVFAVDACRHGVQLGVKEIGLTNWSQGDVRKATHRSYVLVFACGPGQVSQYIRGEDGFSLFTQAFSQALDAEHPASNLSEVLEATQDELNNLIETHGRRPQKIRRLLESEIEDDTLQRIICEGIQPDEDPAQVDPWSEAALNSPLWPEESDDDNSTARQLKQKVIEIVDSCWQQWQATKLIFPQDAWRDENLPIRVLDRLDLLISCSDPPIELGLAEITLVITVPFVREAVLASGVFKAVSQCNPLVTDNKDKKEGLNLALDKLHQAQPRFVRKAKRLEEQGQTEDKDAIMTWLMHRCILRSLEVWQVESEGGYLSKELNDSLESSLCKQRLVNDTLTKSRLLELSRCMFANFERIDRDDRPDALKAEFPVRGKSYREEQIIREKLLAYLLKLAGLLAIDIRILSDVIVDHIGLADPLKPHDGLNTISKTEWKPAGRGRKLSIACQHPAMDLALNKHVEDSSTVLTHIFRQIGEKTPGFVALSGLPTHLLPDGIEAIVHDEEIAYQKPHINFQLSHDEVRELLMGEQLYGDPTLAIRELYQNALDACRYKDARLKYLKLTGKYEGQDETWEGRITFRQALDEQGRAYIECQDNGIGMGMQHLSQCFARAGKRFADLPEFIEEQADWGKYGVKLYPNSQFGVGVLSYFMLADEIEVETCRLNRKGLPGEKLRVRIPGGSGLFRIQKLGFGVDSGTKIRIYLNRRSHKNEPISCLSTLKKLLWVAEYLTEVLQGGSREVWHPGKIKNSVLNSKYCLEVNNGQFWWIVGDRSFLGSRPGRLLADGISTNQEQGCFILNLTEEHYPKMTVDRKDMVEWDEEWINELLSQKVSSLLNWEHLNYPWIWDLSVEWPKVANKLSELLSSRNELIRLSRRSSNLSAVPFREIGCFPGDFGLVSYGINASLFFFISMPLSLMVCRILIWIKYGKIDAPDAWLSSLPSWLDSSNFPVLAPEDYLTIAKNLKGNEIFVFDRYFSERIPAAHIALISNHLGKPIPKILERARRLSSFGFKFPMSNITTKKEVLISLEDRIALSLDDDEDSENKSLKINYSLELDRVSVKHIIKVSDKLGEPISKTIERFFRLRKIGLRLSVHSLNNAAKNSYNYSVSADDLIAFSEMSGNFVFPCELAFVSYTLGESVVQSYKRFSKYFDMGLKLPKVNLEELSQFSPLKESDIVVLSEDLDGKTSLSAIFLSLSHLFKVSEYFDEPIDASFDRLAKFSCLGFRLPQVAVKKLSQIDISPEDIIALPKDFTGWRPWPKKISLAKHLLTVSAQLNETPQKVFERLAKFECIGLIMPSIDLSLLENLANSRDDLLALTEEFRALPGSLIRGRVKPQRIMMASFLLREPLGVTYERFAKFEKLLELQLPDKNPELWKF